MNIKEIYKEEDSKYILENYCLYKGEYECLHETLSFTNYLKRVKNRDIKTIRYKVVSLKYWYEYLDSLGKTYRQYFTLQEQLDFITYLNNKENTKRVIPIRAINTPRYQTGFAKSTIATHVENIKQYYEFLSEYEYIKLKPDELPFRKSIGLTDRKMQKRTLPKYLTMEEVKILVNCCVTLRDKLIIVMMLSTGLRIGELCALTTQAFDFKRQVIVLKREYLDLETGVLKTGERLLKGNKTLFSLLQRYYLFERNKVAQCDNVFVTLTNRGTCVQGTPLDINAVKQMFKRLRYKTGIENCHAHALRHTFATNFIQLKEKNDKVTLAMLQKLLGHKHLDTTMIYTHLDYTLTEYEGVHYYEQFIDENFVDSLEL